MSNFMKNMRKEILLTSSRLQMRSIKEGDAELLKDFEFANLEHFSRYAPMQGKNTDSMEHWEKKIREYLEEFNKGSSTRFLLFDKQALEKSVSWGM